MKNVNLFDKSNSPAGSHCIDLLDFEDSQASQPSSPPKSSKNSTSTTSRARIVKKKAVIASEQSERGKTRQSRSFFSNLSRIASDLQNKQLEIQGDCHAQQVAFPMTEKMDSHADFQSARNDEKTRDCNADFDKSVSNDKKNSHTSAQARSVSNKANCHTEVLAEVSLARKNKRDISGLSPQYDKDIDSHAEKSDFLKKQHIDCFASNGDFASYKKLVLCFSQVRAFSKEEYLQKALNLIDSTKKKDKNFKNALRTQGIIFEMGNAIKERLGVAYFMEFLESNS